MALDRSFTKRLTQTIGHGHMRVTQGLAFTTELIDLALASAGALEILIQAPATADIHIAPLSTVGAEAKLEAFEGTTFSAAGATLTPINRKRSAEYVTRVTATSGPTITDVGLLLDTNIIPGGTGGNASGSGLPTSEEWILTRGETYLFRLTNLNAQAAISMLHLEWYENPDLV